METLRNRYLLNNPLVILQQRA